MNQRTAAIELQAFSRMGSVVSLRFRVFIKKLIICGSSRVPFYCGFLRKEQPERKKSFGLIAKEHWTVSIWSIPSVSLARPPVGWHKMVAHPAQTTTPWAWLKTVVIL